MENIVTKLYKFIEKNVKEGRIPNPDDTEEKKIQALIEEEEPEVEEEPKVEEPKVEEPKVEKPKVEKPEEPKATVEVETGEPEEVIIVLPPDAIEGLVSAEEGEAIAKEEAKEIEKEGEAHPPAALYSLAKEAGISKAKAERYWRETKEGYKKWMGKTDKELTGRDYQYIMGVVKKRMKLPVKPVKDSVEKRYILADLKKVEVLKENNEPLIFDNLEQAKKYIEDKKLIDVEPVEL